MTFVWFVVCIVVDVFVIIANIVEQVLIGMKWAQLDRIDHLLLSLSISDLLSGIATLVVDTWVFWINKKATQDKQVKSFSNITKVFDWVFLFSVFASIFHVIAVAVERLYAIKYPRRYYIFTTFKMKCITIFAIWLLAMLLTPTFSLFAIFSPDSMLGMYIRGCVFAIAIVVVVFAYLYISVLLCIQRKRVLQDFSPDCSVQQRRLKRLTVLCLFIGATFVACVLPITISYFDHRLYHPFANFAVTFNSLINPCIYFVKVYYDTRNQTRHRSDTTHALIDSRSFTISTHAPDDVIDVNENIDNRQTVDI